MKGLENKSIDSSLLNEYYKEISKESVIDKLPSKTIRWSIFTGLGFFSDLIVTNGIATISGLTLSLIDSFIIDKFLVGWKPNNFVNEHMFRLDKKEF